MNNNSKNSQSGKTIRLGVATLDRLEKLRHKGQSYDGLITELLDLHESNLTKANGVLSPQNNNKEEQS